MDDERTGETDRTTTGSTTADDRGRWISAIIALLGVWMIVEAVLLDLVAGQFWNDVVVGLLLLAAGGYNYYRRADAQMANVAAASLAAVLGLWLVASPFVFGDAGAATGFAFWNDVVVGLFAFILGAYSAYRGRDRRRTARRTTG